MTAYTGKDLDLKWIDGSGTATVSGDQTAFEYNPSIELVDQTAGADTNKSYVTGVKDGKASLTAYMQAGTGAGGTIIFNRLIEGSSGTLIWSPEGTATGKPKYTAPMIVNSYSSSVPFGGNVEIKVDFQQNGARVDGAN